MNGMYSSNKNTPEPKKEKLQQAPLHDNTELKIVIQKMNAMNAEITRMKQDMQRYRHIISELQTKIQKTSIMQRRDNDWD